MTPLDATNAVFEVGGAVFQCLNIRQLLKDRRVMGVHWFPSLFFGAWGLWNVIFYGALGQWISLCAGWGLIATNAIWLALVWKYREPQCQVPPRGWRCTREPGHPGPCAAWPTGFRAVAWWFRHTLRIYPS